VERFKVEEFTNKDHWEAEIYDYYTEQSDILTWMDAEDKEDCSSLLIEDLKGLGAIHINRCSDFDCLDHYGGCSPSILEYLEEKEIDNVSSEVCDHYLERVGWGSSRRNSFPSYAWEVYKVYSKDNNLVGLFVLED
jgi:hypothetical protein